MKESTRPTRSTPRKRSSTSASSPKDTSRSSKKKKRTRERLIHRRARNTSSSEESRVGQAFRSTDQIDVDGNVSDSDSEFLVEQSSVSEESSIWESDDDVRGFSGLSTGVSASSTSTVGPSVNTESPTPSSKRSSLQGFELEYSSWSAFRSALESFCNSTFQKFSKRTSTSIKRRNKQITDRAAKSSQRVRSAELFPEWMEIDKLDYSVSYWCKHGRERVSESTGQRSHRIVSGTGCPVRFSVKLVMMGGTEYKIVVSAQEGEHNHQVNELVYNRYPDNRAVVDHATLAKVEAMRKSGAKARGILMYLRNECEGKATTLKDIHNLMARLKAESKSGGSDADCAEYVLRDLCVNDKGAVAALFVDDSRELQTVAFQSFKMRRLFSAFPEVLLVDTTFGTNINRYKLFSFVVHDINGKGQYVQHALLTSESKANMFDAVTSFKKNNPEWRSIKVIVTDKDKKERSILSAAFPNARMLLCQFHVISYLEKKVVSLCKGSQDEKQALKDTMAALVYSNSAQQYQRCKKLLLRQLGNSEDHSLYKYFIKNWDAITEEWVSYRRSNVPHLGNNTNNRIEAKWSKLKDLIRPTASIDECIATLIGLQGICENEYEVELHKVGRHCLPHDREFESMSQNSMTELRHLANLVSLHAFELISDEFKAAERLSTSYKISTRDDTTVELLNAGENKTYYLCTKNFSCSCMFSQTRLLPCRHSFYYRRSALVFTGTKYESVIPFQHINSRWCLNQEINDISKASDAVETSIQFHTTKRKSVPKSPSEKYHDAKLVTSDLTEILQSMGTDRFNRCLHALKVFRDICLEGRVPDILQTSLPATENSLESDQNRQNPPHGTKQKISQISTLSELDHVNSVPPPPSSAPSSSIINTVVKSGDTNYSPGVSPQDQVRVNRFTLRKASKTIGKSKKQQRDTSRGHRLKQTKKKADAIERGVDDAVRDVNTLQVLMDQNYSYELCQREFDQFKIVKLPKGEVRATFKDKETKLSKVGFLLDREGSERCREAIRAFELGSGLLMFEADEIEEVIVYVHKVTDFQVLQACHISTMIEFHQARRVLSKVERAMDWVCSLPNTYAEDVMIGFREFSSCDKNEFNLAIRCCKLKESRVQDEIIVGANVMEYASSKWLNTSCVLTGILFLKSKFPHVGFVHPAFTQLNVNDSRQRLADADKLDCFRHLDMGNVVAGVLHATATHWTAFVYFPSGIPISKACIHDGDSHVQATPSCILYDCMKSNYAETKALAYELLHDKVHSPINFVRDSMTRMNDGINCGTLSLLFLEVHLGDSSVWTGKLTGSLSYYRLRYLRHAISKINE